MKIAKSIRFLCIVVLSILMTSCTIVEYDYNKSQNTGSNEKIMDVKKYINENWESAFVPEIDERKQLLQEVLSVAEESWDKAGEQFGHKPGELGSKFNYIVTGEGTVKEVNTTSKKGFIILELADLKTSYTIKILTGPVLQGTSIRDALKSINFNNFVNQVDYAKLSSELNKFRNEEIFKSVGVDTMAGKTVEFTGCFTQPENGASEINIMPVYLEVK